jgi:hypothetical protein
MKYLSLLLFISFACTNGPGKTTQAPKKQLTPISQWLVSNEDSLANYFYQKIKPDTASDNLRRVTLRAYQLDDGIFHVLNSKIKGYRDCIGVEYFYRSKETRPFKILLTPYGNAQCIGAVDSIFSDIDSLKAFQIVKFRPPSKKYGSWTYEFQDGSKITRDIIKPDDIAFKVIQNDGKYDLTIFLSKKISQLTKDALVEDILGEEIELKKIKSVQYIISKDSVKTNMNTQQLADLFEIY